MSVFDSEQKPSVPFENPNQVTLEDLVGEGKKFDSIEKLAQSYAHSQNHIQDVSATNTRFANEAERFERLEKMLEQLGTPEANRGNEQPEPAPVPEAPTAEPKESITQEDIQKLVQQTFSEVDSKRTAEANAAKVRDTLVNSLGDSTEAEAFFGKRAQELNMTVDELNELSVRNPDAVLQLLNPPKAKETAKPTLFNRAVVNRPPDPNNPTTIEDFNALRKSNFRAWCSPAVQRKLNQLVKE